MTIPKKGDLVIVRERKGAFKRDVMYLAECVIGNGHTIVGLERLSDRLPILVCVDDGDDSKFTIEQVIPKEKLPKSGITDWFADYWAKEKKRQLEVSRRHYPDQPDGFWHTEIDWKRHEFIAKWTSEMIEGYKREVASSLYPLETGDEVDVYQHDRATELHGTPIIDPGLVVAQITKTSEVLNRLHALEVKSALFDDILKRLSAIEEDPLRNKATKLSNGGYAIEGRLVDVIRSAADTNQTHKRLSELESWRDKVIKANQQ